MTETTDTPEESMPSADDQPDRQAGTSPGGPVPDPRAGQRSEWDQIKDLSTLQRPADRMVAGVAAGLARHLNIDPLVLRVGFVVLTLFGGAGLLLYGALWLLLPEDGRAEAPIRLDERSRGVALIGVVVLAGLALLGDVSGLFWVPWPLVAVAVIVWVFFWNRGKKQGLQAQPAPAYGPAGWTPPSTAVPHPPLTRPRDPRRRGPILFWFTLALIALALGVLGTVELSGVDVDSSAYPALALTISAVMLIVGAFWGRAGGIIAIAALASLATLGTLIGENWQPDEARVFEPSTAGEVRDNYELHNGTLTLDLTGVTDVEALDGRDIAVEGGAGRLVVRLPGTANYDLRAEVGVGSIRLLDQRSTEGFGVAANVISSSRRAPLITIETELGVGEIVVVQP